MASNTGNTVSVQAAQAAVVLSTLVELDFTQVMDNRDKSSLGYWCPEDVLIGHGCSIMDAYEATLDAPWWVNVPAVPELANQAAENCPVVIRNPAPFVNTSAWKDRR